VLKKKGHASEVPGPVEATPAGLSDTGVHAGRAGSRGPWVLLHEAVNRMIGTFRHGDSAEEQGAAERKGQIMHTSDAADGRQSPLEAVTGEKHAHPEEDEG
jgi:hypothetical protein